MELSRIPGTLIQLRPDAAASYLRMAAAGLPAGITSGWRSEESQQALRDKWERGEGNYALPVKDSMHVKGIAVDLPTAAREWVRKHGAEYGWDGVKNEAWHFNYNPAKDKHLEDDMELDDKVKLTTYAKKMGAETLSTTTVNDALGYTYAALRTARRAELNTDAILAALSQMTNGAVDPAKIAAAVDKALKDDFAKIPDQVADEFADRLKN